MKCLTSLALLAAMLAVAPAHADQDKNKGGNDPSSSHGQVVSECNHRANERNLKGQDRKDYVEWCQTRGPRYSYDYGRYDRDRDCYRKAYDKGLTGDRRKSFLDNCLDGDGGKRDTDGVGKYGEPRGRDVLGKGDKKN